MGENGQTKKSRSLLKIFSRKHNKPAPPDSKSVALPQEIHDYIIQSLRLLHQDKKNPTCSTCLARDFSSYSLVCKNWHKAVIPHMYKKVSINGMEVSAHAKKSKRSQKATSRAAKLLKTLAARPNYAAHVRELKLPQFNRDSLSRSELLEYLEQAASIVKQCPNLERVLGLYTSHGGWSSPLHQAMATRESLREHVIMFEDHVDAEGLSERERSSQFKQLFGRWSSLEILVLSGVSQAPGVDFAGALSSLPKLRKLMISEFYLEGPSSMALEKIPATVEDLRLENIIGLQDSSLVALSRSRSGTAIHSLSLINVKIERIQTIEHLFSIPNLKRLTIADNEGLPYFDGDEGLSIEDSLRLSAKFASASLTHLHWDVICTTMVEKALADAISSKLPSLRVLRAPSDKTGLLQAVCKPMEGIALPGDFAFETSLPQNTPLPPSRIGASVHSHLPPLTAFANSAPHSRRTSISSRRASVSSYRSSTFSSTCSNQSSASTGSALTTLTVPIPMLKPPGKFGASKIQPFARTLPSARLRAQKRIDRARQDIKLQIIIEDTDTKAKETISLRGFIGDVKSKVVYSLQPDAKTLCIEARDNGDAFVRFKRDVLERAWKRECMITPAGANEVCTGSWNIREVAGGKSKKEKVVGAHIPRRRVELDNVTLRDLFI